MAENGYFDAEPLVAFPINLPQEFASSDYNELKDNQDYERFIKSHDTHFIVAEGNRRLGAAKLLFRGDKATFPKLNKDIEEDLSILPAIIYPKRKDVLAYLGARHIIGTRKWDASLQT